MAIKPSKYTIRKQQTGSLNASSATETKKSYQYHSLPNYTNKEVDVKKEEDVELLPYSEENFLQSIKYKGFVYYSSIQNTFWYLCLNKNPVLMFSNNLMEHKYNKQDIKETDLAYEATHISLSYKDDNNNHEKIESVFHFKVKINDFSTLPIKTEKKHLMHFYARATQDDSKQWFGITTLSALYLMNKDLNQIKNLLSHFSFQDKVEILEHTINNAGKKENTEYLNHQNLKEHLIQPLIDTKPMFESLLEYYVMKENLKIEQDKNKTNEVKSIKLKKF